MTQEKKDGRSAESANAKLRTTPRKTTQQQKELELNRVLLFLFFYYSVVSRSV